MSTSDAAAARAALESELRAQGVGGAEILLTISENLRSYLWVAQIRRRETRDVVMEEIPKRAEVVPTAQVSLEAKFLLEADNRILDIVPVRTGLLVLDAERIALYLDGQQRQAVALPRGPMPRDLRGRLVVDGEAFQAYIPGQHCSGTLPLMAIVCRDESLWPAAPGLYAQFMPGRNCFDGRIVTSSGAQKSLPAFYSAAMSEDRGGALWLLAGMDGRVHVYNSGFEAGASWGGWGSDIAAVESGCRSSRLALLATNAGDSTVTATVSAYAIVDGLPQTFATPVNLPGPLTALWAARGTGFAVSKNLRTGRYAAFSLSISCNN